MCTLPTKTYENHYTHSFIHSFREWREDRTDYQEVRRLLNIERYRIPRCEITDRCIWLACSPLTRQLEKWSWACRRGSRKDFAFVRLCFPSLADFYDYNIYKTCKTAQLNSHIKYHEVIKWIRNLYLPFTQHFNFLLFFAWTGKRVLHPWMLLPSGTYQEGGAAPVNRGLSSEMPPKSRMCRWERAYTICFRRQASEECLIKKPTKQCLKLKIIQKESNSFFTAFGK